MVKKVLNLKQERRLIGKREIFVVVGALFITVVGIRAADRIFENTSENSNLCPKEMVFVPSANGGFCIDRFEASVNDKCPNINPENELDTKRNLDSKSCKPVSVSGKIPWRNISQIQAREACAKIGKRLPTAIEWYLASQGTPDKNSAWGREDCNLSSNWPDNPGGAGTGGLCESSFGAFDMVGNVWEWINDDIVNGELDGVKLPESGYVVEIDSNGIPSKTFESEDEIFNNDYMWIKKKGLKGIARGGYWESKGKGGKYAAYLVSPPTFVGPGVGFRCVR